MMPRRNPILRGDDRDSSGTRHEFSWPAFQAAPTIRTRLGSRIKNLFVQALKELTAREQPAPKPTKRSRTGRGEIGGAFTLAARSLLRPIASFPVICRGATLLLDTLAWLHLWDWNDQSSGQGVEDNTVIIMIFSRISECAKQLP